MAFFLFNITVPALYSLLLSNSTGAKSYGLKCIADMLCTLHSAVNNSRLTLVIFHQQKNFHLHQNIPLTYHENILNLLLSKHITSYTHIDMCENCLTKLLRSVLCYPHASSVCHLSPAAGQNISTAPRDLMPSSSFCPLR